MSASKIQIGQLWKKDGTKDIYLVTRLYSEALNTIVILRKSGAEDEAQIRVRVERAGAGQTIPGFLQRRTTRGFNLRSTELPFLQRHPLSSVPFAETARRSPRRSFGRNDGLVGSFRLPGGRWPGGLCSSFRFWGAGIAN